MKLTEAISADFFRACFRCGLILDTNAFLPAFTNIEADENERDIIKNIVSYCGRNGGKIILTPHVLTEITNLIINRPKNGVISEDITKVIIVLNGVVEHYSPKDKIMQSPGFDRFGFADMSIVTACKTLGCGVLTGDNTLYAELLGAHCHAMNFKALASQSLALGSCG